MLSSGRMEEFVTEEEEPWYDQQDLEQGKTRRRPPCPAASTVPAAGAGRSAGLHLTKALCHVKRRQRWHVAVLHRRDRIDIEVASKEQAL